MLLSLALISVASGQEEVVVTATREEAGITGVARGVSVADEDTMAAQQARTLPEALEQLPGVWMQRTNRGAGSPFLRGLVGPQNLVLVDELPHNLSTYRTGPNQYLALIDPLSAQRVEVVRGPSSVLYGNGAMGGVIQVVSADPIGSGADGQALLQGASADRSGGAYVRSRVGSARAGLLLGGGYTDFHALRVGGGSTEPLSDFEKGSWHTRAALALGGGHAVGLTYRGMLLNDAGRTDSLGEGAVRFYDNQDHIGGLFYRFEGTDLVRAARVQLAGHRWVEIQDRYSCAVDGDAPADLGACLDRDASTVTGESIRDDRVTAEIATAMVRLEPIDGRLSIMAGGEGQLEQVSSTRRDRTAGADEYEARDRGNFSPGSRYQVAGAYLWGEGTPLQLGPNALAVRGGVRLSHFGALAEDVPQPDAAGAAAEQDVDYAFTGVVGSGGLSLLLSDKAHLWGSFLQGFRAPNLEETTIFGPEESRFSIPNPDLRPERSDTVEVGLRTGGEAVSGSVIGWATWIQDALDDAPTTFNGEAASADGLAYSHRINVAGARYRGAEAELRVSTGPLAWRGDVAWTWGETDTDSGTAPARRVPPVFGGLSVSYPSERWWVGISSRAAGPQARLSPGDESDLRICAVAPFASTTYADQGAECPGSPGWIRVDVRGGVQLNPALALDVALGNLTDARYRTHGSGIDAPGFDARASLRAQWGPATEK